MNPKDIRRFPAIPKPLEIELEISEADFRDLVAAFAAPAAALRYRIDEALGQFWPDPSGQWVAVEFEARGGRYTARFESDGRIP